VRQPGSSVSSGIATALSRIRDLFGKRDQ